MAVIAQADPYQSLIRKIGYSVGLEKLVERVSALVELYVRERSISASSFRELIETKFGRTNATDHFANFYSALNLVRAVGRDRHVITNSKKVSKHVSVPKSLEPLYQLDSLSILRRIFEKDDTKFRVAVSLVLTQSIVEADGDIFINCLASDFETAAMKARLELMVKSKRAKLVRLMHSPGLKSKIFQIVDIKNESGGADPSVAATGRFARRTEPLTSTRRTTPLRPGEESTVDVPLDYLGKASVSRRSWAEDLGLFKDASCTERGHRFLRSLGSCVDWTSTAPPAAMFWGYQSDLEKIRVKPEEIGACSCEPWELLVAIADAWQADERPLRELSPDDVISFLRRVFDLYKEGNSKGLIRNSLPLYVAQPVLAGWCVAEGHRLPNLAGILEAEFVKDVRRVQKMIIRGTSGALFFMSEP